MSSSFGKVLVLGLILTGMMKARVAQAVDLIDTPSLLGAYSTPVMIDPTGPAAQSFTTTSSGYVLNQLDLWLYRASGDNGTYSVSIFTAVGSGGSMLPGSSVASLATNLDVISSARPVPVSVNGDGSDVSPISFTGLNLPLSSTPTNYFVLVSYSGSYSIGWATVSASSPTFNGNNTYTVGPVSGAPTNFGDSDPTLLKITAGTTVPEPSTWAMAVLAVAGLAASARRRAVQG